MSSIPTRMDAPWEHELERALVSQLASVRLDGDETNDGGDEVVRDADAHDDDRAAQLDELTALASIFGDDLCGPAAADAKRAARELEGRDDADADAAADDDDDAARGAETKRRNGLLRFHLDVEPESYDPNAGHVDAESHLGGSVTRVVLVSDATSGGQSRETFPVAFLPAVRLSVIFPRAYPSAAPPAFALSAPFLPRAALERCARALRRIWDESGPGTAVVFSWVEYLRERALREAFAADEPRAGETRAVELRLAARDGWLGRDDRRGDDRRGVCSDPSRGVPTSRSPDEALVCVLRNDALARARRYARATHFCGVCFAGNVPGTRMRRCAGRAPTFPSPATRNASAPRDDETDVADGEREAMCDHAFCVDCLHRMCVVHVTEGTVGALRCPEPACSAALAPGAVRSALLTGSAAAESLCERYEKLSLERGLDAMVDLTYCPRCETAVLEDEDGDHCAQCSSCLYAFCALCREAWHPGAACLNPERRLQVLESRARGGRDREGDEARRKHREAVADAMAHRYVEREGKRCPTCGAGVVKSEGCNKMQCGNCDAFFCYKCGDAVIGYEHFREGGKCSLFDAEAIAGWEREMNAGLAVAEARERDAHVAGLRVDQSRCPACRQPNFKLGGNNHVGCWSCGQHYCHACRSIVRRGAATRAHFGAGAGKCRQHTND